MFTARVKADGRFFIGAIETDTGRDAHALENGKKYSGQVFDSDPSNAPYIEFSEASWGTFDGTELEVLPGNFRLMKY